MASREAGSRRTGPRLSRSAALFLRLDQPPDGVERPHDLAVGCVAADGREEQREARPVAVGALAGQVLDVRKGGEHAVRRGSDMLGVLVLHLSFLSSARRMR
jgi:hypothetical protein